MRILFATKTKLLIPFAPSLFTLYPSLFASLTALEITAIQVEVCHSICDPVFSLLVQVQSTFGGLDPVIVEELNEVITISFFGNLTELGYM